MGPREAAVALGSGPGRLTVRTSGRAASVIAASAHMAPIQPNVWISRCEIGANANWPNDPPALMMPAALPRFSAARWGEAAPINTEKLPAPEPMADRSPNERMRPSPVVMKGVMAVPSDSNRMPATRTLAGP